MLRSGPPFPDALLHKLCTENSGKTYNKPIGKHCEIRHILGKNGEIKKNEWSCIGCRAIFTETGRGRIRKRYKVPAD